MTLLSERDSEAGKIIFASSQGTFVYRSNGSAIAMGEGISEPDREVADRHSHKGGIDVTLVSKDIGTLERWRQAGKTPGRVGNLLLMEVSKYLLCRVVGRPDDVHVENPYALRRP